MQNVENQSKSEQKHMFFPLFCLFCPFYFLGNRVMRERIRRFKSSSLRQQKRTAMRLSFLLLSESRRGFEGGANPREWIALPIFPPLLQPTPRQRRQLIIAERGAPLKAQILFSAPTKAPYRGGFFAYTARITAISNKYLQILKIISQDFMLSS